MAQFNPYADRIEQLRQALAAENISYGELAEIDAMAESAGVYVTDEMMAGDILDAIESGPDNHEWRLVRYWDDIHEREPVKFYRARQEDNGRWLVEGAERWRYDTSELAFYGPYVEARDADLLAWQKLREIGAWG